MVNMANCPQTASLKPSSSKENFQLGKKRYNFTLDDVFKDLSCGFVPQNTSVDTEKCVRLLKIVVGDRTMLLRRY